MDKKDIKNILISLRKPENESFVNTILGKLDLMDEKLVEKMINKKGNNEESIRLFLQQKIKEENPNISSQHFPINKMFTYGVTGDCVHLHLPGFLTKMFEQNGFTKSMDIVNIYLLDALDRLNTLKNSGFYRLEGVRNIYMISPLIIAREIRFLNDMHFTVRSFKKAQLKNDDFVAQDSEAQLAVNIFGKDRNVSSAMIAFYTIGSKEWQYDKNKKLEEFAEKGITIEDDFQHMDFE